MRTNGSTPAAQPASPSFDAWLSLIQEPDQRFLTQKALLSLLQTAANNIEEFGPDQIESAAWLTMMVAWLVDEDGRERGFVN